VFGNKHFEVSGIGPKETRTANFPPIFWSADQMVFAFATNYKIK
jgi:hypothetical protein